jgi:hypothetical protein
MGAPGYAPHPELPAHAPMPGAPPYPEREPTPAVAPGRPRPRSRALLAPAAAAAWAVLDVLLTMALTGTAGLARVGVGLLVGALLTALLGGWLARGRSWPLPVLLLVVAPLYWVLRAVATALLG